MIWTQDDIDRLVAAWNDGRSAAWIARRLGCGRGAVIGKVDRLRNAGVPLRARSSSAAPAPSRRTVPAPPRWTEEEDIALRDLVAAGLSPAAIAAQIGRPLAGMRTRLHALRRAGFIAPPPPRPRAKPARQARRVSARTGLAVVAAETVETARREAAVVLDRARDRQPRPVAASRPVALVDAPAGACHWPVWSDVEAGRAEGFPVCGAPALGGAGLGRAYCAGHARRGVMREARE